ncbi:MAG TPA: uracil-DNA glycosylase family protein [Acidimicrobiia bacterium]|nr:uracil-DNA glycosylase family protein [Acidimicrobiia bacterium]
MDHRTVRVYEESAVRWRAARRPRFLEQATAFGRAVAAGAVRIDVGCGPGRELGAVGAPVVALDAAAAMLDLARVECPAAWCVQADLEHLPVRAGSIGGAWARASYLHIPRARLPWALMELHQVLAVGSPIALVLREGTEEGPLPDDDFPDRLFAEWDPTSLREVVLAAGFEVEAVEAGAGAWIEVRATRARTLPDFVGPGMRVLVCGLNPSEVAADRGVGFAGRGNRFWPAALASGLVTRDRDPRHALRVHGVGMTDLVKRASPRADGLGADEYRAGAERLERLVRWLEPAVVCFAGLTGYRTAIDRTAGPGPVPGGFAGAAAYVMPNPSGVNTHASLDDLTAHLAAVGAVADRAALLS